MERLREEKRSARDFETLEKNMAVHFLDFLLHCIIWTGCRKILEPRKTNMHRQRKKIKPSDSEVTSCNLTAPFASLVLCLFQSCCCHCHLGGNIPDHFRESLGPEVLEEGVPSLSLSLLTHNFMEFEREAADSRLESTLLQPRPYLPQRRNREPRAA